MKRIIALIVCVLLLVTFAGCTETYLPGSSGSSGSTPPEQSSSSSSSGEDGSGGDTAEDEAFTATLKIEEGILPEFTDAYAVWTNKNEVFTSKFSKSGVAKSIEPDGEYQVTVHGLPEGYTYDPNAYRVDNENKSCEIELLPISEMAGSGKRTDADCFKISKPGTYRMTFTAPTELFFTFSPNQEGEYQFRSLMDATANEINAGFYKYAIQFINPRTEITSLDDATGATNTFTQNFKTIVQVPEDELAGSRYYGIQLFSSAKDIFPVSLDIQVEYLGTYVRPNGWKDAEVPQIKDFTLPSGNFVLLADTNGKVLDQDMVKFAEVDEWVGYIDGDGYYRVNLSGTGYKRNADGQLVNKQGEVLAEGEKPVLEVNPADPVLFANIGNTLPFLADPGGLSYGMVRHTCGNVGIDYTDFFAAHAQKAKSGYVPVTEALKEYLYNHSVSWNYFWDGNGNAEAVGYQSAELDQWLFACGYFR